MVRPPRYLRFLYPGVTWHLPTSEKVLYLTFDDGPVPEVTPQVLDLLEKYKAKATFFCIGDNVRKSPDLFERICSAGHQVGNHTYHHYNAWKVNRHVFLDDVAAAKKLIPSNLFRPPYGKLTPLTLLALRKTYQIIMWDVISCDFDVRVRPEMVLQNVLDFSGPGSIIVFHDSIKAAPNMLYALPKVLEHFSREGYTFRALENQL